MTPSPQLGPEICPNGFYDPSSKRTYKNVWMLACEYQSPGNYAGAYTANVMRPIVPPSCPGIS